MRLRLSKNEIKMRLRLSKNEIKMRLRLSKNENRQTNGTCPPSPTPLAFMTCPPNSTLPNPRLRIVSNVYCRDVNATSNRTNQFFTIFSQFVDHDFTLTLDHGCQKPNDPTCINVIVPPNDTQRANGSCLEVITSLTFCEQNGCQNDPFNTNTGFLDDSSLYGSTIDFSIHTAESSNRRANENLQ